MSRLLQQGRGSNQGHTILLHTYKPQQISQPSFNFINLTVPEIWPGQDFIGQGLTARSKVKSRSNYDIAHLHPLTNVPTKYQLPSPYSFRDIDGQDFLGQSHYGKVKGQTKATP